MIIYIFIVFFKRNDKIEFNKKNLFKQVKFKIQPQL